MDDSRVRSLIGGEKVNAGDYRVSFRSAGPALAMLIGCWIIVPSADAASLTAIYRFTGGADGGYPTSGVVMDASGALYGTTSIGGRSGLGTVFKLAPPGGSETVWTETVLYSFNGADGDGLGAQLVMDKTGALYGTTLLGGNAKAGTVFRLTPPAKGATGWSATQIYAFGGGEDGVSPVGKPIFGPKGELYGATGLGGINGNGTVYELVPPSDGATAWSETVLHSFGGGEGYDPAAGPIIDASGTLYGTTEYGGTGGTVYTLTPPSGANSQWTETLIHVFGASGDGYNPIGGLVTDGSGALYGTTERGGGRLLVGTVFKLARPSPGETTWNETVLHAFSPVSGRIDGRTPEGSLIIDSGLLFGTTVFGGAYDSGTIFSLMAPVAGETARRDRVVHNFGGPGSQNHTLVYPNPDLLLDASGAFYGTTPYGETFATHGTVFRLTR